MKFLSKIKVWNSASGWKSSGQKTKKKRLKILLLPLFSVKNNNKRTKNRHFHHLLRQLGWKMSLEKTALVGIYLFTKSLFDVAHIFSPFLCPQMMNRMAHLEKFYDLEWIDDVSLLCAPDNDRALFRERRYIYALTLAQ